MTAAQEILTYSTDTTTYEGLVVRPTSQGDLDGISVLFAHDFLGPGENQLNIARDLAARGALSMVADFYGQGIRPEGVDQANEMAMAVRGNIPELRRAMTAALAAFEQQGASAQRMAVVGTSVGGLAALELGRTGADVGAIVVIWGVLENTNSDTAVAISVPVTVLQGDMDPLSPAAARDELVAELSSNGTPHEMIAFEGVAHAFTLDFVGDDPSTGFAYDAEATKAAMAKLNAVLLGL